MYFYDVILLQVYARASKIIAFYEDDSR